MLNSQSLQEIQIHRIVRELVKILEKNYVEAFSIMKSSFYSLPTQMEHKLEMMARIVSHHNNWKKAIFLKKMQNIEQSDSYWKLKGVLLMMPILNRKYKAVLNQGLHSFKKHYHDVVNTESIVVKLEVSGLVYSIKTMQKRLLLKSFIKIKEEGRNRQRQLIKNKRIQGSLEIRQCLNGIMIKFYKHPFTLVKNNLCELQSQNPQTYKTEIENETITNIEMIKTILVSINRQKKRVFNTHQNSPNISLTYAPTQMFENLNDKYRSNLYYGFNSIYHQYLAYFDQDTIVKLDTQIKVLRQQFDL